jgi:hypothetical protein
MSYAVGGSGRDGEMHHWLPPDMLLQRQLSYHLNLSLPLYLFEDFP